MHRFVACDCRFLGVLGPCADPMGLCLKCNGTGLEKRRSAAQCPHCTGGLCPQCGGSKTIDGVRGCKLCRTDDRCRSCGGQPVLHRERVTCTQCAGESKCDQEVQLPFMPSCPGVSSIVFC